VLAPLLAVLRLPFVLVIVFWLGMMTIIAAVVPFSISQREYADPTCFCTQNVREVHSLFWIESAVVLYGILLDKHSIRETKREVIISVSLRQQNPSRNSWK